MLCARGINAGKVSRDAAELKAANEYERYEERRRRVREEEGELEMMRHLEDAMKKLPRKP